MVSPATITRVTGVEAAYKNFNTGKAAMLPQRLSIIGLGNDDAEYGLGKREVFQAADVAATYGWGSPLHLAAAQLLPAQGAQADFPVSVIPLYPAEGSAAARAAITADGSPANGGAAAVYVGGVKAEFAVQKGATPRQALENMAAAIAGVLSMPAMADGIQNNDTLALRAKWSGDISNDITLEVDSAGIDGITFSVQGFKGGALDPGIKPALDKIAGVWETFILNTFSYKNRTRLDEYQNFAQGRWGALEKTPCLVAHGCTDDFHTRTAVTKSRPDDYANFLIVSVKSRELPFVIAAKGLLDDIVTTANRFPAQNYKGRLAGLAAGSDESQENTQARNASVIAGSSNNIKTGSIAELNDIVTFYAPESEGKFPSKRYVVDCVKLMNIVYNVRLVMEAQALKGAPLVPDRDNVTLPVAVQPKAIKTSLINLADSLAANAIISDAEFTKRNLSVSIDKENPKRLNTAFPCKLSGNIEVSNNDIYFGFYLGG